MAGELESSLQAAREALQQGDYPTAISYLEAIYQNEIDELSQVRAQGEFLASAENSEISRELAQFNEAIALCQILSHSSNPQVKEWAVNACAQLSDRDPTKSAADATLTESDLSGFIVFDSEKTGDKGDKGDKTEPREIDAEKQRNIEPGKQESTSNPKSKIQNPKLNCPSLFNWRQAERAKRWQALPVINLIPFWLLQCGSAITLFWLVRTSIEFAMAFTNDLLVKLPYLEPFQPFYHDPTQWIVLMLLLLLGLSPWLLDLILRLFYGLKPLSLDTLSTRSPEAIRVLQRYCRQRKIPLPHLAILPTSAPLVLTYGNLPRTARIVISQGLLEQLADDEIATIYAAQLGHITHWDFVVMSLNMTISQLPYIVYRLVSQWGDKTANSFLRVIAAVLAHFAYGIWFLLSLPAFWLSQLRIYLGDRVSSEITGNPNALIRAIIKVCKGIADEIQQQGQTSWLLESWSLLSVVSYQQAIAFSSLHSCDEIEAGLAWDCSNPGRYWLNINNTHPLIGDRLQRLTRIAHYWRLETELNLTRSQESKVVGAGLTNKLVGRQIIWINPPVPQSQVESQDSKIKNTLASRLFLLQIAPYLGIFLGLALAGLMWLIGGIGKMFGIAQLGWMWGDWAIAIGCLPIGFSIGTFIRINAFFPDIKPTTVLNNPSLSDLLANSTTLPVNSQPLRFQAKLLGRPGISNWLGQDLIVQLPTGLVKLHHFCCLGSVSHLLLGTSFNFTDLLGRYIFITGWFRRGATVWIDIDTLRTSAGKISRSEHPIWSTLIAIAAAAWGLYAIAISR
jgi:Zn-dependent protease with chaperone function